MNFDTKSLLSLFLSLNASFVLLADAFGFETPKIAPTKLTIECKNFIEKLPVGFKKGWVRVPENWGNRRSAKIDVFYYYSFSRDNKNLQVQENEKVLYLNGGPLADSHGTFIQVQKISSANHVDVVYMDQRGTGCSSPFESKFDTKTIQKASLYGTTSVVKDAEFIRQNIFKVNKWNILGHSHGGTIANRYITLFPNSLANVYIYAGTFFDNFTEFYYNRILAQNRIIKQIDHDFPGTIEKLKKVRNSLTENDCFSKDGISLCGPVILDAMFVFLSGTSEQIKAQSIDPIMETDGTAKVSEILKIFKFTFDYFLTPAYFSTQALLRQEFESKENLMQKSQECALAYDQMKFEGIESKDLVIDECRFIVAAEKKIQLDALQEGFSHVKVISQIKLERVLQKIDNSTIQKVRLYSGGMDGLMGFQAIEEFSKRSSKIIYTHFPNLGHGGFKVENKIWSDIASDHSSK